LRYCIHSFTYFVLIVHLLSLLQVFILCAEYYVHCPLSAIHLLKKTMYSALEWGAGCCQLWCRWKWSQRSSV